MPEQRKQKRKRIPGYTPESETAEELNVSVRTLRKWRQLRIGPPWSRSGARFITATNRAQRG